MKRHLILFFCLFLSNQIFSQNDTVSDSVDINLIDNYITSEKPHVLVVSFFTSLPVKSKIIIDNQYEFIVTKEFAEDHQDSIDISKLNMKSSLFYFVIQVEDSVGRKFNSETYEVDYPKEIEIKGESNFLLLCLFGGTVFLLPSPEYVYWGGKSYFGLTKEIPLVFIRSGSFSYPTGYFSLEYSYLFHSQISRSYMRVGYKHILEVPGIEYISPGINGFTNFNGFNGISPELSVGLLKIADTFTLYARYRYNYKPGDSQNQFSEISLGLYSGFFAIYF
jgi:hypothetical protein